MAAEVFEFLEQGPCPLCHRIYEKLSINKNGTDLGSKRLFV